MFTPSATRSLGLRAAVSATASAILAKTARNTSADIIETVCGMLGKVNPVFFLGQLVQRHDRD